jgi:hypothetical protein
MKPRKRSIQNKIRFLCFSVLLLLTVHLRSQQNPAKDSFITVYSKMQKYDGAGGFGPATTPCGIKVYVDYVNNLVIVKDTLAKRTLSVNAITGKTVQNKGGRLLFMAKDTRSKEEVSIEVNVGGAYFVYFVEEAAASYRLEY